MKNKKQEGNSLEYKNGSGSTITSGTLIALAARCAVAVADISAGKTGTIELEGVYECPKATGVAFSFGDVLYRDATTGALNKTASGNVKAGICADVDGKLSADTVARVLLQP